MEALFKGCGTALVTPFKSDGSVDFDAYETLVRRQVESGVDFLVPLATTGETPTLSDDEKITLLRLTRKVAGSLPLLVGAGSNSVPGTLRNMEFLSEEGLADAWLIVVPFYNKPTQEGQYQYFKAVAAASSLPVVIYNVPGRTGANMTAETCVRLAKDVPNIIATKEASGKIDQVAQILKSRPEGFAVLSGDDDMTLDMMKLGAEGVISVASNIAPAEVAQMAHLALDGDFSQAEAVDSSLQPLFKTCFVESNPIPAKAALSMLGLCTDTMRLPLVSASAQARQAMQDVLETMGLI